jgi:23S rRNA pseudouridine1911/1915/1917 synthase
LERREGVTKTYAAITWGAPDRGDGATSFRCEKRVELDPESTLRVKMRISESPGALEASTTFQVEEIRMRAGHRPYARVRCGLESGRQHQIRVHLASLGAPVVGDKLYGPDERAFARAADGELTAEDEDRLEMPRHALHAQRLEMPHPITGDPLCVEAPWPADMSAFWERLRG